MRSFRLRRSRLAPLIIAAVVSASIVGCDDPAAPLPREGPPDELRFEWGGFVIDAVTIELHNDEVLMWTTPWSWTPGEPIDTVPVVPTAEQWREFWSAADAAGVRFWRSRYAANVVDGVGWTLRLVAGSLTVESTGANAYPDGRGRKHELEMTAEFRALRAALGELAGVTF
jgi:hypothetical protein